MRFGAFFFFFSTAVAGACGNYGSHECVQSETQGSTDGSVAMGSGFSQSCQTIKKSSAVACPNEKAAGQGNTAFGNCAGQQNCVGSYRSAAQNGESGLQDKIGKLLGAISEMKQVTRESLDNAGAELEQARIKALSQNPQIAQAFENFRHDRNLLARAQSALGPNPTGPFTLKDAQSAQIPAVGKNLELALVAKDIEETAAAAKGKAEDTLGRLQSMDQRATNAIGNMGSLGGLDGKGEKKIFLASVAEVFPAGDFARSIHSNPEGDITGTNGRSLEVASTITIGKGSLLEAGRQPASQREEISLRRRLLLGARAGGKGGEAAGDAAASGFGKIVPEESGAAVNSAKAELLNAVNGTEEEQTARHFVMAGSETDKAVAAMISSLPLGSDMDRLEQSGVLVQNTPSLFWRVHRAHERCETKGCLGQRN